MYDRVQTPAYANWDEAMRREPAEFRYRSMAGIAGPDEYVGTGLRPEDCDEFNKAKAKSAERLVDLTTAQDISNGEIVKRTGCPNAIFSRMKYGRKAFCAPAKSWERMSYDVMHTSVHDFLFGENRPLTLPKKYSIPAAIVQTKLTPSEQDRLAAIGGKLVKAYYSESNSDCGHHRPMAELIRERITEIKESYGFYKYQIFGKKETPTGLKSLLTAFWQDGSQTEPKFAFLAYAALYYKEQNMDYLVSEDPIRDFFDTYALSETGEKVLLTGSNKEFWRDVLILDPARKQRALETAWTTIICRLL